MRLDGIDILRGFAVTTVIVYHFFVLLELTNNTMSPYVHAFGSLGVPLFFVISGYLIYRSIERNIDQKGTKEGLLNYFFHRLFRIIPAYYFNLLIVFLMASFLWDNDFFYSTSFFKQLFSHLTFSSYFIHKSAGFGINGAYWTLGIEMLWYILAPLFFIFFNKTRTLFLIMFMSFLYTYGLSVGFFDTFFNLNEKADNYTLLLLYYTTQIPGQITYFIAGILIYKYTITISLDRPIRNYLLSLILISLFVIIIGYYKIHLDLLPSHLLLLILTTLLFIFLYQSSIKGMGILSWIGKISYSLYLWHMPILYIMNKSNILEHRPMFEAVIFFLVFLISISAMSYYFIEEGGFALRKKLTKKFFTKKTPSEIVT